MPPRWHHLLMPMRHCWLPTILMMPILRCSSPPPSLRHFIIFFHTNAVAADATVCHTPDTPRYFLPPLIIDVAIDAAASYVDTHWCCFDWCLPCHYCIFICASCFIADADATSSISSLFRQRLAFYDIDIDVYATDLYWGTSRWLLLIAPPSFDWLLGWPAATPFTPAAIFLLTIIVTVASPLRLRLLIDAWLAAQRGIEVTYAMPFDVVFWFFWYHYLSFIFLMPFSRLRLIIWRHRCAWVCRHFADFIDGCHAISVLSTRWLRFLYASRVSDVILNTLTPLRYSSPFQHFVRFWCLIVCQYHTE